MNKELIIALKVKFDDISHFDDENGIEFWYARELQEAFEYTDWRNFVKVIDKAKAACVNSEHLVQHHFVDANKMINLPKGAQREIEDVKLTRFACYLIAQNGDPR